MAFYNDTTILQMKNMITVLPSSTPSLSDDASLLDTDKNSAQLDSLNDDWTIEFQSFPQYQPYYHLNSSNSSQLLGDQYHFSESNASTTRYRTPPIQQLLNSFGSSRTIETDNHKSSINTFNTIENDAKKLISY